MNQWNLICYRVCSKSHKIKINLAKEASCSFNSRVPATARKWHTLIKPSEMKALRAKKTKLYHHSRSYKREYLKQKFSPNWAYMTPGHRLNTTSTWSETCRRHTKLTILVKHGKRLWCYSMKNLIRGSNSAFRIDFSLKSQEKLLNSYAQKILGWANLP